MKATTDKTVVTPMASASPGPDDGQPERLAKTLKAHWVWAIALGSAVGWGAFILPTDWLAMGGPLGAISGFLIGGALMVLIAVSYGFLIKSFPVSGGELAFALVGFGRTHAFFCGWFLTLGYTCIVALNASALALLFRKLMPDVVQQGYLYTVAGWDVYLVEILISMTALAVFAYLNIRGTALSGRIQFIACVIMLIAVVCILAAVIASPQVIFANAVPAFPEGVNPIAAIAAIVAIAPWAFIGFDNVPQAAEEFDFPPAKAMKLIVLALLAAALLYAAMIAAVAMSAPWEALVAGDSAWGTADALTGVLGGSGMLLLTIGITMGVSTGLNGFYVSASRILLGMGRAQMVPKMFARLHPKYKTPYVGVIFVGAVCLISPWFGRAALTWVVDMSAVGVTVAYLYTCLCAFKIFRPTNSIERPGDLEGTRSTSKKVLSAMGAVTALVFMALLLIPGSPGVLGKESMTALAVWTLLGVVFFMVRRKHNKTLSDEQVDVLVLGAPRPEGTKFKASAAGGKLTSG
ncbi:APC family permease [Paeniglutamicibacter gangotriensis]|uniref:Putative cationic amino acid transporter APC family protein n=1 Tax=Paeniglutamicibacter gangotriensis Lz1y TaxID=1276920 RepID=M7N6B6_9MICC|nr:APC family permease [Paeniglutamicibacter gangotriensis]EMQ97289.1 putative cationic amino acid transporter APC family protein [Paeniglutamicibacter gangotriensis Lz1y]